MVDKLPEGYVALDDLQVWGENYNQGDVGMIYTSILKFGFNQTPRVWKDRQIRAGNHSVLALRMVRDNGCPPPPHVIEHEGRWYIRTLDISYLSDQEAIAYAIADNRTVERASHDEGLLIKYLRQSEDEGLLEVTGYDTEDLARLIAIQELPDGFKEYDETVANDVEYITCPHCGEQFPK